MEVKGEYLLKYNDFPQLLKTLLEENVVDKIIGAKTKISRKTEKEDRLSISPEIYEEPDDVEDFPLSNLIAYGYVRTDSAAKYLHSKLNGAKEEKIGMVARPCDTRALVELAKIRQVNLENLFIIAMEDRGMIVKASRSMRKYKDIDTTKVVREMIVDDGLEFLFEDGKTQKVDLEIADNCSRCVEKTPALADLSVSNVDVPIDSDSLILKVYSDKGKTILEKSGLKVKDLPEDLKESHSGKLEEIVQEAKKKREKDLSEWNELSQEEKIEKLQKCTMCGMCIRACPVCYCVDCILQKKRKEKTINNETYQLTRVAHVADRCVECGSCDNNCPMSLPLSLYFQSLSEAFKKKFNYKAGESVDDVPFRSGKAIREMELERT
ncbi:MAG: 4Fe-4S dicluster domain-containing protein [Promethearchaeia archaeon]